MGIRREGCRRVKRRVLMVVFVCTLKVVSVVWTMDSLGEGLLSVFYLNLWHLALYSDCV
jgi:hypothetical protein